MKLRNLSPGYLASLDDEALDRLDRRHREIYSETEIPEGFSRDKGDGTYELDFSSLSENHRLRAPMFPSEVAHYERLRQLRGESGPGMYSS